MDLNHQIQNNQNRCSVFDVCGGCSYQHLNDDQYKSFKTELFQKTFLPLVNTSEIFQETIFIPPHTRRRTTLSFFNSGSEYVWGYKQEKSHKIISAQDCVVVTPRLLAVFQPLSDLLRPLIKQNIQAKAMLLEAENGIDIFIKGIKPPHKKYLVDLNKTITQTMPCVTRIQIDDTIIFQTSEPFVTLSNFQIPVSSTLFLQPSEQGQDALIKIVTQNLISANPKKKKRILDLFCGFGTFSLGASALGTVCAYDNASDAIESLNHVTKKYNLINNLKVFARDLFRDPLSFLELNQHDIVIIDPPRAGASSQMHALAKSKITKVIYVFCDTKSAYKDIKILLDAQFKLESLYAIDQFTFSSHIEGIAILTQS